MKCFGRLAGYCCAIGGLMLLPSDSVRANDAFVPYGAWRGHIRYVRGPFRTKETMRWGNGITPTGGMVLMHGLTVAGEVFGGAGPFSKDAEAFAKETPSPATIDLQEFSDTATSSKQTLDSVSNDLAIHVNKLQGTFTKDFHQPVFQRLAMIADRNHRLAVQIAAAKDAKNSETPLAEKSKESWAKVSELLKPYQGAKPAGDLQGRKLQEGIAAWKHEEKTVNHLSEAWSWLHGLANSDTRFSSDSAEAKSAIDTLTQIKDGTFVASPSITEFYQVINAVDAISLDEVLK